MNLLDQVGKILSTNCPLTCDEIWEEMQQVNKSKYTRCIIKKYIALLIELGQVDKVVINTVVYYRKARR